MAGVRLMPLPLDQGLDAQAPMPLPLPTPRPYLFVRGAAEFVAALVGGGR